MEGQKSTRYFSTKQEENVCKALGAYTQSNSGAGHFRKGDCINKKASLLIECKTVMKSKDSISIKKDWVKKNKEEAFSQQVTHGAIAVNFGPDEPNYYLIDESLMTYLVKQLEQE